MLKNIKKQIDLSKINSTFIGCLTYTTQDYKNILKLDPNLSILWLSNYNNTWFVGFETEKKEVLYEIFNLVFQKNYVQFG